MGIDYFDTFGKHFALKSPSETFSSFSRHPSTSGINEAPPPCPSVYITTPPHRKAELTQGDKGHFEGTDLLVSGNSMDTATIRITWTGPTTGGPIDAEVQRSTLWSDPNCFQWKAKVPDTKGGDYTITAQGDTATDKVSVKIIERPKPDLVIGVFFDGTGNNMEAEPEDRHTNVAKLWKLYNSPTTPIYIQGVGTMAIPKPDGTYEKDLSLLGLGMGLGPYGAETRLKKAQTEFLLRLEQYKANYGTPKVIIFDVFGFSRGAMLARHFVNMVNEGLPDISGKIEKETPSIFPSMRSAENSTTMEDALDYLSSKDSMFPRLKADIRVRFLGIYDSVGSFYWPGNEDEGFINANLAEHSAEFVYHPTARDEIRKNFPLTRITTEDGSAPSHFVEEEFYGAHSDIGGGYNQEAEKFLVASEEYDPQVDHYEWGEDDPEWREEMLLKKRMIEKDQGIQCLLEFKWNTAYFFELRPTKPELSLVALNAMHQKALSRGVPLNEIDPAYEIPSHLKGLVVRAQSGAPYAEKLLDEIYIHTSHRRLLTAYIDKTIGLAPEEDGLRDCFPNHPFKAIQQHSSETRGS